MTLHLSVPPEQPRDYAEDHAALDLLHTTITNLSDQIAQQKAVIFVLITLLAFAALDIAHLRGWLDWSM